MAKMDVNKIRNLVLLGHGGAGKTSLVEAMLYNAGAVTRMGTVQDGNTVTDFEPEEIERTFTISSAIAYCDWKGARINLLDTPGFNNFLEDARGCLRAADGAILLASAQDGVKAEAIKLWQYACETNMPAVCFINKMDKENVDFKTALKSVKDSFELEAIPFTIPIGSAENFTGVVDILNLKAYKFSGKKAEEIDVPEDLKNEVDEYRTKLVESIAETDDALLEKYLDGNELTQAEINKGVGVGTKSCKFIPVFCGSSTSNFGVLQFLDCVSICMPSPVERAEAFSIKGKNKKDEEVERKPAASDPVSAFVFKTIADPYAGQLSLFRVFSGEFKADSTLLNSTKGSKERIGHVAYMLGKKQNQVDVLGPGEIGVVAKLKNTGTGDTLCDAGKSIIYDKIQFADPLISYAIEPKSKADEDKVSVGLHKILDEDLTLDFHREDESNEMIIAGMGQLHIEVSLQKLKRKFGVEVEMHSPKIPYRETLAGTAKVQGKYKKQSGGRGQYGDCWISVKPQARGEGFNFVNNIVGGSIPRQYIPAVEKGIIERLKKGVIAGYQMVDIEVSLYDGSFHAVDSSEMAFKIAGSLAIKKASEQAQAVLLEPIMKVEITVPDETLGTVIGDLNSRRGKVDGVEPQPRGDQKIIAQIPMAEMLTYANQLSSMTSGRGVYTMEFEGYEQVPAHIAQTIIDEYQKKESGEAAVA